MTRVSVSVLNIAHHLVVGDEGEDVLVLVFLHGHLGHIRVSITLQEGRG